MQTYAMTAKDWAEDVYFRLLKLREHVEEHQKQKPDIKRLQPLHHGLLKAIALGVESVEQYFQPQLKQRRCLRCNARFESLADLFPVDQKSIGWCKRCSDKVNGVSSSSNSSNSSTSAERKEGTQQRKAKQIKRKRSPTSSAAPSASPSSPSSALESEPEDSESETEGKTEPARPFSPSQEAMSRDSEAETAEKQQQQQQQPQPETAATNGKSEQDTQPDSDSLGVGPLLDLLSSSASSSPSSVPALCPISPVSPLLLMDLSSDALAFSAPLPPSSPLPLAKAEPTPVSSDATDQPPRSQSTNSKSEGKGKRGKAKSRKGKQRVTKELPATQTSKHAKLTHDIRNQAKHIASQLSLVWSPKEEEVKALDKTMSFVPGQSGKDFSTAIEASQIYVQQSRFGRKIDVYTRFACGRCARPFYEFVGGPSYSEAAAARFQVANKRIGFKDFCNEILGVTPAVVRAEIEFSLLCDICPPLLAALARPENAESFRWSWFVHNNADAVQIWREELQSVRPMLQESGDVPVAKQEGEAKTASGAFPVVPFTLHKRPFEEPEADASEPSVKRQRTDALDVLMAAVSAAPAPASASALALEGSEPERCSICQENLDTQQGLLDSDTDLTLVRWDAIARALKEPKHHPLARRRVRLDCGGGHEFCYGCIVSYYLQSGNTCPLCRERRFSNIAGRAVPDRDGGQALSRRTLASVNYAD